MERLGVDYGGYVCERDLEEIEPDLEEIEPDLEEMVEWKKCKADC